ncbi:hypothetical protein ABZ896_35675 [Streptomyces sp. NPDC047072]|uniref:hypothetical protein n=1 Tax=Streptomyces sp. NPDC047072 TaxID=3154809 RepID=UPI0033C4AEF9
MTTRTTFEERLLAELRGEVERREVARREAEPERVGLRRLLPSRSFAAPRLTNRLLTGRRLALAAAVCALAGLAVLLVPGTPAGSPAFAVERHDDGSVTLTAKDQFIDVGAQRELAKRLRPNRIEVEVHVLRRGYVCEGDPVLWVFNQQGEKVALRAVKLTRPTTLRPGNVLVFVNLRGGELPHRVDVFPTRADVVPCVPVKPTPDRS